MLLLLLAAKYEALNSKELSPISLTHVQSALDGIYIADEEKRALIYRVFEYTPQSTFEDKYYLKKLKQVRKTMVVEFDDDLEERIIQLKGLGINANGKYVTALYIEPFNLKKATEELGIESSLLIELVRDLVAELRKIKEDYYECARHAFFEQNYLWAHRFKGVSANLRLQRIYKIFDYIEHSKNKVQIKDMLDELYSYLTRLDSELNQLAQEL